MLKPGAVRSPRKPVHGRASAFGAAKIVPRISYRLRLLRNAR